MKNRIGFLLAAGLLLIIVAACGAQTATTPDIPRPSNPGAVGEAVALKGDPAAGEKVYVVHCYICHKGGVANPGSVAGTVPSLNPVDDRLKSSDYKIFASNLDLFIEHGSTPEVNPSGEMLVLMPNWGDSGKLSPQQIADVISYIISLNP